ncbi:FAD-dependent monooxygenase [Mycobacterium sp.]|uniref:FAD-dependent monooxygenase n=1 Tax=Mycobacterium sp. TaxID=1785 RepID=UPI002D8E6901|nr:FAD-dependent monooxygenase [Mycobacterium sp.]
MDTDVVVVGAGPTGLALACGLRAAGVGVRVIDKAQGPAVTSRALGLQPRGVEVLDRLGALGDLPARAIPIRQVVITVDGRQLARLQIGLSMERLGGRPGLVMSQADIERALRDRLSELGEAVEWGRGIQGLEAGADRVSVRLDDGTELDAGWVVGADGAHSAVRKALGIGFPGVPLVERFLLADVHAALERPRDSASTWMRGTNLLAAFPLPGSDLWRLMAPAPPQGPEDPSAEAIVDYLGTRLAEEAGGEIRSVEWTSAFRIHRRLADSYRRGRVLLAGDAAHIHSPLGGQGMNTGIGDAENLAWKLALVICGRANERLLDTYEAERRPIAEDVLESTSGLTEIVMGGSPIARFVRDRVAVPLMNRGWVQRLIAKKASQLQVSYRDGPLGAGRRRRLPGLRPGDRVPDRDGMYNALGPAWVMLGPESMADVARRRIGDVVTLRGHRDAMLVRPDGHLAWRGDDASSLHEWLDSAFGERQGVLTP